MSIGEDEQRQLSSAEQALVAGCMERNGFEYRPQPFMPARPPLSVFGALDIDQARRFGYHDPTAATEVAANGASEEWLSQNGGAKFADALFDCFDEAFQSLYEAGQPPDSSPNAVLLNDLYSNAMTRATNDDRIGDVMTHWSRCMKQKGFDFAVLSDAWMLFQSEPDDTSPPGDLERSTALADAECQAEARYVETITSLFNEEFAQELDAHPTIADDRRREIDDAVRRAAEVLSDTPTTSDRPTSAW